MGDARRGEGAATVRAWAFAAVIGAAIGAAMGATLASVPLGVGLGLCFAVVFAVAFAPSVDLDPGEVAQSSPAPAAASPLSAETRETRETREEREERLIMGDRHVVDGNGAIAPGDRLDVDPDRYDGE